MPSFITTKAWACFVELRFPHQLRQLRNVSRKRRASSRVVMFFNKIKQCGGVATRYDKLAANYLAFIQLASIRLWLRVNKSPIVVMRELNALLAICISLAQIPIAEDHIEGMT